MKMCDKHEILYIEDANEETNDVQKVFGENKNYLNDISLQMFLALKGEFIQKAQFASTPLKDFWAL